MFSSEFFFFCFPLLIAIPACFMPGCSPDQAVHCHIFSCLKLQALFLTWYITGCSVRFFVCLCFNEIIVFNELLLGNPFSLTNG